MSKLLLLLAYFFNFLFYCVLKKCLYVNYFANDHGPLRVSVTGWCSAAARVWRSLLAYSSWHRTSSSTADSPTEWPYPAAAWVPCSCRRSWATWLTTTVTSTKTKTKSLPLLKTRVVYYIILYNILIWLLYIRVLNRNGPKTLEYYIYINRLKFRVASIDLKCVD